MTRQEERAGGLGRGRPASTASQAKLQVSPGEVSGPRGSHRLAARRQVLGARCRVSGIQSVRNLAMASIIGGLLSPFLPVVTAGLIRFRP